MKKASEIFNHLDQGGTIGFDGFKYHIKDGSLFKDDGEKSENTINHLLENLDKVTIHSQD